VLIIRTWNVGCGCGHSSATGMDDVGFIDTLLDVLVANYAIDTNRIYATGMSNGGFMSYRLACELSSRIAAIAPVAASMSLNNCTPQRPVPIIHFHSYLDSNVPFNGGIGDGVSDHYNPPLDSVLNAWAEINGCQSGRLTSQDDVEFTKYQWTDCECGAEIEWYLTQDGGHSWPGGEQTLIGDPVSHVISANDLMWDSFSQHSLDCNIVSSTNDDLPEILGSIIYPNPSSGEFEINVPLNQNSTIYIYDHYGSVLNFHRDGQKVFIPEFANGLYLIKVFSEGQEIISTFLLINE